MPTPLDKPKLRWWQFSLRKFVLLGTLCCVLAVAGYRFREWGRALTEKLIEQDFELQIYSAKHLHELQNKYWLPLKIYEWTNWRNWQDEFRQLSDDDCIEVMLSLTSAGVMVFVILVSVRRWFINTVHSSNKKSPPRLSADDQDG